MIFSSIKHYCLFAGGLRYASRVQRAAVCLMTTDITGCEVRTKAHGSLLAIDDNIMRIITLNDKNHDYSALSNAAKLDPDCGMLYVLTVYDCLRTPRSGDGTEALEHACASLNRLWKEGRLSSREKLYYSYLHHWVSGNFFKAAMALESVNLLHPHDTLAMKLAQESHIASGNNYGALTCITRYMPLIGHNHAVGRNLLSILTHGFVEGHMLADAEETAERVIEMTSSHDLTAISGYLNMLLLTCKATDASAVIDRFKEKHYKTPLGRVFFGYYNGYSYALRGNNSASIREIGLSIDALEANWLKGEPLNLQFLANSSLLLWYVGLNIKENHSAVKLMWNRLSSLWHVCTPQHIAKTPFEEMCSLLAVTMALTVEGGIPAADCLPLHLMEHESLNSNASDADNAAAGRKPTNHAATYNNREYDSKASTEKLDASVIPEAGSGNSFWGMFSFNKSGKDAGEAGGDGEYSGGDSAASKVGAEGKMLDFLGYDELVALRDQQEQRMRRMATSQTSAHVSGFGEEVCTLIEACDVPRLRYKSIHGNDTSSSVADVATAAESVEAEQARMVRQFALPFCSAVQLMTDGSYEEAAAVLFRLQPFVTSHLGSTVLHMSVIETTLIEACLRGGLWDEAQGMLLHRTTTYPNEAQSWRRLALLMHQKGHMELANSARFTAFELGIGQGGYGGSQA